MQGILMLLCAKRDVAHASNLPSPSDLVQSVDGVGAGDGVLELMHVPVRGLEGYGLACRRVSESADI